MGLCKTSIVYSNQLAVKQWLGFLPAIGLDNFAIEECTFNIILTPQAFGKIFVVRLLRYLPHAPLLPHLPVSETPKTPVIPTPS